MTKIYLIRHCEAEGNHRRVFQGHINTDVTELGEKQLDALAERFRNIDIDKIYSSPLIRAMKTAEAAVRYKSLEVIPFDNLIEINGGVLEDKLFEETFKARPDLADAWNNHPQDFAPEEGEPMWEAYERIFDAIKFLAKINKDTTFAISAHGGVVRCLLCRLLYNDIKRLKDVPWSDNTAISLITVDDYFNFKVEFFNNASHLPEELIPLRSRLDNYAAGDKE